VKYLVQERIFGIGDRVRDTYAVEVAPDAPDVALVLGAAVCVDALAHPDDDGKEDD
jgi:uncharacterized protein YxjI